MQEVRMLRKGDSSAPVIGARGQKIAYRFTTGIMAALSLFAAFSYLSGDPKAVEGFAHLGYPQQLRIILGIAKGLGAIVLVIPGFGRLKEWAYAGFTFAWISAAIAHWTAHERGEAIMAGGLLVFLFVSYMTRPANRQWQMPARSD